MNPDLNIWIYLELLYQIWTSKTENISKCDERECGQIRERFLNVMHPKVLCKTRFIDISRYSKKISNLFFSNNKNTTIFFIFFV